MSELAGSQDYSAPAEIDRLVHEPARLAVMALLYVVESADFTFLMNQTGLLWGNLPAHTSKLEEAGYLQAAVGSPYVSVGGTVFGAGETTVAEAAAVAAGPHPMLRSNGHLGPDCGSLHHLEPRASLSARSVTSVTASFWPE